MQIKPSSWNIGLIHCLMFLFPAVLVTVPKSYGVIAASLILLALIKGRCRLSGLSKQDILFIALILIYPAYLLLDLLFHRGEWGGVDYALRAFICVILLLFWREQTIKPRYMMAGMVVGAVWGLGLALYQLQYCVSDVLFLAGQANQAFYCGDDQGRPGGMTNPIPFAQIMAVYAMVLLIWRNQLPRFCWVLGVVCAGLTLFLSGTRGAMLGFMVVAFALPLFMVRWNVKKLIAALAFLLLGMFGVASSGWMQQTIRITEFKADMSRYEQGDANTSSGIRLMLWQQAWQAFQEKPLLGLGSGRFSAYLAERVEQKQAPAYLAQFGHAHNQYLETLANNGALGLAALLLSMLGSAYLFMRRAIERQGAARAAACSGGAMVGMMLVFNLTQPMYAHHITAVFYFLMLAVFWHLSGQQDTSDSVA
jgi:O-antigen ligase